MIGATKTSLRVKMNPTRFSISYKWNFPTNRRPKQALSQVDGVCPSLF